MWASSNVRLAVGPKEAVVCPYCLAWLILMVEAAAKSWATPAIVQADSRVVQTSVKISISGLVLTIHGCGG